MLQNDNKITHPMPFKAQILFGLALCCFLLPLWIQYYQGISGKILISTPIMAGDPLAESVILIIHNNLDGAAGLVLNQPLSATDIHDLPSIMQNIPPERLFWGGPVAHDRVSVLQFDPVSQKVIHSYLDVIIKINPEFMNRLHQVQNAPWPKFYVGYAGWAPLQLELERLRKIWLVGHIDWEFIRTTPHADLWQKLNERIKAQDRFNSKRLL